MGSASLKTCCASPVDLKPQALSPNNRIVGYDLARAVAILGMLLVNFSVLLGSGTSDPTWLDYLIEMIKGRAAATFVVLAGVGLSLLTKSVSLSKDRAAINAKRLTLLKRSFFLLVIGLFNFFISPISDILHFYAVYIAIGACLLTLSNRSLAVLALATITARPVIMIGFEVVKSWDFNTVAGTGIWNVPGVIGHFLFNGCFPVIPWMAFVMVGMWIGRRDLSDHYLRKKILLIGIGAFAFSESVSRVFIHVSSWAQLDPKGLLPWFGIAAGDPTPLCMLSAMGTALVVISLSMMLADRC
ncbi:MAG: heparan-alpha-glucosaminide N-acetyltransferase domain-containing protein, partial [Syntrophobacterales bacterium]